MAEFPCAAMRRRLFDPPKSIHLFIEKPREFIDIFRNSLFSNAAMRFAIIHVRVLSPMTANAGSIPTDEGVIVPVSVLTDEVKSDC